jgi:hypothetical protein
LLQHEIPQKTGAATNFQIKASLPDIALIWIKRSHPPLRRPHMARSKHPAMSQYAHAQIHLDLK